MTSIFDSSISALSAAQAGLATTQHNIANASTPGYNRQIAVQVANAAQATGAGFIGQGVNVSTVKRMYDQFLSNQVTQQQTQVSQLNTYYSQIQQINNMLADPTAGITPAIQNFFNAVNTVASSPDSTPARQTMIGTAQSLASTFQTLNQQLTAISSGVNGQITNSVISINSYAKQIANLNQSIVLAQADTGQPPNDLMDQRDQIVTQLNQQIGASVIKQADGSYNVSIGTGQQLVVGSTAYGLQAVQSQTNPSVLEVAAGTTAGSLVRLSQNSLQGGTLGGLLAFNSQTFTQTQNMLGLVATGVAGTFNQQHALGMDLNGNLASTTNSFFTDPTTVVNKNTLNTGTATVTAAITNYANLTGSDYSLAFDGTKYTVTRLSDNTVTTALPAGPPTVINLTNTDGISISIPAGALAGDSYLIRPTVNGAANISVAVTDPAKVAAATPVMANASLANTGTATINAGTIDATYTLATLAAPVKLTYNSATNTFSGFPAGFQVTVATNASPPVTTTYPAPASSVPYSDGATISFGGASFSIAGTPVNGDTFTVSQSSTGTTDNRNALLLAGLQSKNTMQGGTSNYEAVYSQMVSQIGVQTNSLKINSAAQTTLLNQTTAAQQSLSGVNLDEEAANLLRYQQAYQAAGKAMQIASTLFDTLLSLGK